MNKQRLEFWVWVLIYVGLLAVGLGLALLRHEVAFAAWVLAGGAVLALLGVVLIVVRARLGEDEP